MKGMTKELRHVADAATDQGWTITTNSSTHTTWTCPRCGGKVYGAYTPGSGTRTQLNFVARLRKHGFSWKGRTGSTACPPVHVR